MNPQISYLYSSALIRVIRDAIFFLLPYYLTIALIAAQNRAISSSLL